MIHRQGSGLPQDFQQNPYASYHATKSESSKKCLKSKKCTFKNFEKKKFCCKVKKVLDMFFVKTL